LILTSAATVFVGFAIGGQPLVAIAAPGMTIQSEEAAHPRVAKALHQMKEALHELEAAPDDFGGNKAAAIRDTRAAIHSLKKALYFRLHMDDAALDKAE
jgi:hypothetical protein